MSDIVWEDPPSTQLGRPADDLLPFVAELKKHPGKWAISRAELTNGAYGSRGQRLKKLGCQITCRKQTDLTWTLYARWPEESDG